MNSQRKRQVDRVFGRVAWALIVALASPDFCKAQLLVEPERRRVAGRNFQIQTARFGLPGRPAEGFDQALPDTSALPVLAYTECKNFGFVRNQPAQNKSGGRRWFSGARHESSGTWMIEQ